VPAGQLQGRSGDLSMGCGHAVPDKKGHASNFPGLLPMTMGACPMCPRCCRLPSGCYAAIPAAAEVVPRKVGKTLELAAQRNRGVGESIRIPWADLCSAQVHMSPSAQIEMSPLRRVVRAHHAPNARSNSVRRAGNRLFSSLSAATQRAVSVDASHPTQAATRSAAWA